MQFVKHFSGYSSEDVCSEIDKTTRNLNDIYGPFSQIVIQDITWIHEEIRRGKNTETKETLVHAYVIYTKK